jgi:hypothetical protein
LPRSWLHSAEEIDDKQDQIPIFPMLCSKGNCVRANEVLNVRARIEHQGVWARSALLSALRRGACADGNEAARSSTGPKGRDRRGGYRPCSSEHLDKANHQLISGTSPRAGVSTADHSTGDDINAVDHRHANDHCLGDTDDHRRANPDDHPRAGDNQRV